MSALFKFLGLILIFSACTGCGLLKSSSLQKRKDKLYSFSRSLSQLAEYIKADGGEIELIFSSCFEKNCIEIKNFKPCLNKSFLEKEDIALLEEFLDEFGIRDAESEYRRTLLYASLIEKQGAISENKCKELCNVYNKLGVLSGLFLCIFLI